MKMQRGRDSDSRPDTSSIFLVLAAAVSVVASLIATPLALPSGDEFLVPAWTAELDYLASLEWWYFNWGGRFSSLAVLELVGLLPHRTGPLFAIEVLATQALFFASIVLISVSARRRELIKVHPLGFAICFYAIYLSAMPSISEGVYSLTYSIVLNLGNASAFLLASILLHPRSRGSRIQSFIKPLAGVVGLVSAGFYEITTLAILAFTACGIFLLPRDGEERRTWIWALAGASVGAVLLFAAPGNFARSGAHPDAVIGPAAVLRTLRLSFHYIRDWSTNPIILMTIILVITCPSKVTSTQSAPRDDSGRRKCWMISAAATATVMLVGTLPAASVYYHTLPSRFLNSLFMVFLAGTGITLTLALRGVPDSPGAAVHSARVLLALTMLFQGNGIDVIRSLPESVGYHREVTRDFETLERASLAAPTDTVLLPAIEHDSPVLRIYDGGVLSSNPSAALNKAMAQHFGVAAVVREVSR